MVSKTKRWFLENTRRLAHAHTLTNWRKKEKDGMQRGGDKDKNDGGSKTDSNTTFIPVSSTQDKAFKKWYLRCFHWKWSHVQHVYRVIITWISQTDVKGERQQSRIAGVQKNLIMFWSLSNHFTLFLLDMSIYFIQMWIKRRFDFFNKNNFSFSAFILVETVQMPTKTVYYHYLLPHL